MTRNERLFVIFYLGKAKGNATLAAALAGYKHPRRIGNRLSTKVHIREAIEAKLNEVAMSEEEVLIRLSERAASDPGAFIRFNADGSPDQLPALDLTRARRKGQLGNLKKIKTRRTPGDNPMEITEVELYDALPALALLAKYHGLIDKGKVEDETAADPIEEIAKRGRSQA